MMSAARGLARQYTPILGQVASGDPTGVEAEMQTNCSWAAE